jgi:hypothetical protein
MPVVQEAEVVLVRKEKAGERRESEMPDVRLFDSHWVVRNPVSNRPSAKRRLRLPIANGSDIVPPTEPGRTLPARW